MAWAWRIRWLLSALPVVGSTNTLVPRLIWWGEAAQNSLSQSLAFSCDLDVAGFVNMHVSRDHHDCRNDGCTVAALCGDAARQLDDWKATFTNGIELAAHEENYQVDLDVPRLKRK